MNGVMMPSVSAGSSQRDASVMCTPHVIVPAGVAAAGIFRVARLAPVVSMPCKTVLRATAMAGSSLRWLFFYADGQVS